MKNLRMCRTNLHNTFLKIQYCSLLSHLSSTREGLGRTYLTHTNASMDQKTQLGSLKVVNGNGIMAWMTGFRRLVRSRTWHRIVKGTGDLCLALGELMLKTNEKKTIFISNVFVIRNHIKLSYMQKNIFYSWEVVYSIWSRP